MSNKNTTKSPIEQTYWQHPIKPGVGLEAFKIAFVESASCHECGSSDVQVYGNGSKRCRKCGATWL